MAPYFWSPRFQTFSELAQRTGRGASQRVSPSGTLDVFKNRGLYYLSQMTQGYLLKRVLERLSLSSLRERIVI